MLGWVCGWVHAVGWCGVGGLPARCAACSACAFQPDGLLERRRRGCKGSWRSASLSHTAAAAAAAGIGVARDEGAAARWAEQVADVDIDGALIEMGLRCVESRRGADLLAPGGASWLLAAATKGGAESGGGKGGGGAGGGSKEAQYKLAHYYAGVWQLAVASLGRLWICVVECSWYSRAQLIQASQLPCACCCCCATTTLPSPPWPPKHRQPGVAPAVGAGERQVAAACSGARPPGGHV